MHGVQKSVHIPSIPIRHRNSPSPFHRIVSTILAFRPLCRYRIFLKGRGGGGGGDTVSKSYQKVGVGLQKGVGTEGGYASLPREARKLLIVSKY